MLRKDFINWRRHYKRSTMEIVFPMLVFVVLAVIRASIEPSSAPFGRDIERHATILMPMSDSVRLGLSNEEDARKQLMQAIYLDQVDMTPYYRFHNFSERVALASNMFGKLLADNCESTDYHRARTKWALVGDPDSS